MIVGYLYNNLPLPKELVTIILEYYGNDDINYHIKKIILSMLNSNGITKFDLIRLSQIKLPPKMSELDDVANYFNYNNNRFCFETPWINIFSKYPFATNPYVDLNKFTSFNLPIGLNKLGNYNDDENYNLRKHNVLDSDGNNSLLNFLLKFENYIFIQICKSFNQEYDNIKFNKCVLPKEIMKITESDVYDDYDDSDDSNDIIGYSYQIKLQMDKSITKYYYIRKNGIKNILEQINVHQVNSLMKKKVKYVLVPIFKVYKKTMFVSFFVKKMILQP